MKRAIVGYTGFVGSNILASYNFTNYYNSKNQSEAYGTRPDLLVYAGVPSTMFLANSHPEADLEIIEQAIENIKLINADKVVLISSVAVYDSTVDVDEDHIIDEDILLPYGKNRLYLEKWVSSNCKNSLIVRLPALYGMNLKKNFIYDYINIIPTMLNKQKYCELSEQNMLIKEAYRLQEDGFYHFIDIPVNKKKILYTSFLHNEFNALNFTDSRSIYQFYCLGRLWNDIVIALNHNIKLLNIVSEPVSIKEVYQYLSGKEFDNELSQKLYRYEIKSKYAEIYGGKNGYMIEKKVELSELKKFVKMEIFKKWG